jgi:hypothetical protein
MSSTPNVDQIVTQIEAAEKAITALKEKRVGIVERIEAIAVERRQRGYDAHVSADRASQKALTALSHEAVGLDGQLVEIDGALAEAALRLEAAQREEVALEDRKTALAVRRKFKHLVALAKTMDEAMQVFGMAASSMAADVQELHALGQGSPNGMQFMTFGWLACGSTLMFLPWARVAEYRHLAPSERRSFTGLFKGWADAADRNVALRLGEAAARETENAA